ncbi:hypothetical protein NW768_010167 [Fusarium equiseti]|uniref:Peptidase S8/S53 domain-containing protein n=1 Tax=Fusarium equiseti TaxID=61235 RepID=A0ABQ8R184_FUSEQ|nr:hypothetical protein NW768_010167 [Fusarium equiseti]
MEFYKDGEEGEERLGIIKGWKDFVEPDNTSNKKDEFGHGSLMARLIMEICPSASILIARVAKDTKHLPKCEGNIAQAIKWAREQGADIVSMSFGLPHENDDIAREINPSDDKGQKKVIFLASAGNSPDEPEAFPARLPSVISIYATKRDGIFLGSNAQRPSDGSKILGTFGDGVPPEIQNEFDKEYRDICRPGSSIACAVAAGIGAIMLSYVSLLPDIVPEFNKKDQPVLEKIKSTHGMATVFRSMAVDKSGDYWLTPVPFWRNHKGPYDKNRAICVALLEKK